MGQIDGIVANGVGSELGDSSGKNTRGVGLLPSLVGVLTSRSERCLVAMLGNLISGGLAEAVSSWLSTGPNQLVTGEQLKGALPPEMLFQFAIETGTDPTQVAQGLSRVLPSMVDHLSPNGALLRGSDLRSALGGFAREFSGNR